MKKFVLPITLLFSLLLTMLSIPTKVTAETSNEEVILVIHKLLLGDQHNSTEAIIKNDGSENPEGLELLKNQVGLNGVEFSIFDVTDEFYDLRESGKTVEESQIILSQLQETHNLVVKGITDTVDSEDGILSVSVPKQNKGKEPVYLIKETNRPEGIKEESVPLVVVLPIYNNEGQALDLIHLYIKNNRERPDVPILEKSIEEKNDSYSYGEAIAYTIQTVIPQDILQYKSYELVDEADPGLWLIDKGSKEETVNVSINGVTETDYYDITELRDHGFTIQFDPQKLGDYVGKTIKITYEMELKGKQSNSSQTEFPNIVELTADNRYTLKDTEVIKTGGYHFVKVDMTDSDKTLSGAKFIVLNQQKLYLKEEKEGAITWVKDKKQASEFLSNQRGQLAVYGLSYGSYSLIEVEAPTGYIINQQPISFEVTQTSEQETKDKPLKIINKIDPKVPEQPDTPNKPSPGGHLPQTNDTQNRYLIVVGSLMLILIILIKLKGERQHEKK